MSVGTELISVGQDGSLTILNQKEEPTILQKFRYVFRAEWCGYRKVYWYDSHWGSTRLRQVLNFGRTSKKEDKIIAIFRGEPDIDVMRLAIANVNRGKLLTGVRWEIYRDFECIELEATGRFDFIDLCTGDRAKLRNLIERNIVSLDTNLKSWDFDALFLTHMCPRCKKFSFRDVLMFVPEFMQCENCSFSRDELIESTRNESIVEELFRLSSADDEGRFPLGSSQPTEVFFIDVAATAVICWFMKNLFSGSPAQTSLKEFKNMSLGQLMKCFQRSIFPKINNDILGKVFRDTLIGSYEHETAEIKADNSLPPPFPEIKADEFRAWRLRSVNEMKNDFIKSVEAVKDLENWFLLTSAEDYHAMSFDKTKKRTAEILKAMEFFAVYLEKLLDIVWQQGKERENGRTTN
ncbi:MAG: hypothetical protein AAB575_00365 [Patescibacteria group bacterium]